MGESARQRMLAIVPKKNHLSELRSYLEHNAVSVSEFAISARSASVCCAIEVA
jgi:hypothetical protein